MTSSSRSSKDASQIPSSEVTSSAAKPINPNAQPPAPSLVAHATRTFFDPWNSSSTGHQRAENHLARSTSWRESRNLKLGEQFIGGLSGGRRVSDTVGAGSQDFGKDGRKPNGGRERGVKCLRIGGQKSLVEVWGVRKGNETVGDKTVALDGPVTEDPETDENAPTPDEPMKPNKQKQIFEGLCFYLNGSTAPLVSDHKLKHLLVERGGKMSIGLGRRSVTHVVLGTANGSGGAGGGLAASKIQREITRVGGKGVKFVGVEWVLECIKADKRLPEARFSTLKLAPKGQNSVYDMFRSAKENEQKDGFTDG
ncbi:hypothetical protein K469DRAFT_649112 [Zopfia rhizophila CBS 207.26]|uniref:BRCT domain-containing protein n=1 Tax=Zopfia rhizophila CBS 207.26 TaxID=1314779 RepID=A0A6A6EWZ5_9PEZI|nr:hypothetical protein K469DRAFT_649112 [Zopfia rhizophila CBS 207.26]